MSKDATQERDTTPDKGLLDRRALLRTGAAAALAATPASDAAAENAEAAAAVAELPAAVADPAVQSVVGSTGAGHFTLDGHVYHVHFDDEAAIVSQGLIIEEGHIKSFDMEVQGTFSVGGFLASGMNQ